jgi:hypothetical protein
LSPYSVLNAIIKKKKSVADLVKVLFRRAAWILNRYISTNIHSIRGPEAQRRRRRRRRDEEEEEEEEEEEAAVVMIGAMPPVHRRTPAL